MSAIESEAVFRNRSLAMGLVQADLDAMRIKGWVTFSRFAFASSFIPGQGDDATFVTNVVELVLGDRNHARASILRRLYFESYTLTAADLRSKVERSGDEPPKKMPAPERHSRYETIKAKLTGVDLRGPNEPSHHLIDICAAMLEEGVMRYIPWEDLSSRDDELKGVKKIKEWKPTASGTLKEVSSEELKNTDLTSDLKIYQALNRRGVALEMSNLMEFSSHDKLTKLFIREYQREPPEGYSKVSIDQIVRADQEAFRILADETREGLAADGMGIRPLDKHIDTVMTDSTVRMMLMPLVHRSKAKGDGKGQKGEKEKEKEKKKQGKGGKAKGDGKGQKGGKNKKRGPGEMPGGLEGSSVTKDGKRICYGFNLGTCSEKGAGCPRGRRVCTKCQEAHPSITCVSEII
jgi:hypothetical protein